MNIRRTFVRHAVGCAVAFAGMVLWLNHTMMVGSGGRAALYLLAAGVPVATAGSYAAIKASWLGHPEAAETGVWLVVLAAVSTGLLWLVTTAFY